MPEKPVVPDRSDTTTPTAKSRRRSDATRARRRTKAEKADDKWLAHWAPRCPDGNPQRYRQALGYRERDLGELELRVELCHDEGGVCEMVVDEHQDYVMVRVLICYDLKDSRVHRQPAHETICPVRRRLDAPLGNRTVIDADTGEELPDLTEDIKRMAERINAQLAADREALLAPPAASGIEAENGSGPFDDIPF